jgi:hypothetical protein
MLREQPGGLAKDANQLAFCANIQEMVELIITTALNIEGLNEVSIN